MKVFFCLFTILFFFNSFCVGQTRQKKKETESDGLKGKVKQVKQNTFKAAEESGKIVLQEKVNNKGGNFIKVYDDDGFVLKWQAYRLNDSLQFTMVFEVKEQKHLSTVTYLPDGSILNWILYKFNGKGWPIEVDAFNKDSTINKKTLWKHDINGNTIEVQEQRGDGTIIRKSESKVDNKGDEIKCTMYADEINISGVYRSVYDDNGNKIKESYYDYGGKYSNFEKTFLFDDKDNLTEEKIYNDRGKLLTTTVFTYEYDVHGSWIKKIELNNGTPVFIIVREITYF